MNTEENGLRESLAKRLCDTNYDCAEAAGWAKCDHAFGYRDADAVLALPEVAELRGQVERVQALGDWHRVTTCDCGHAAFCHKADEGICTGGLALCQCRKSLITIFRERLDAALASSGTTEPESAVQEVRGE